MKASGRIRIGAFLVIAVVLPGCADRPDSVSGASMLVSTQPSQGRGNPPDRPVIVTPSGRGGAARLASAMAARLGARVVSPASVKVQDLEEAPLVGFGSGIFDQAHHKILLDLAGTLPPAHGKKAFIFSTSGVSRENAPGFGAEDPHKALRERLVARGFEIVGEFNCVGYNDNSFLFLIGGINRGRPNARDVALAEAFAGSLPRGGGR